MARRLRASVTILDTSAIYALVDRNEPMHGACVEALESLTRGTLVVSPFVLAEADYLVATRLGLQAELALLNDVERGAYHLAPIDPSDVAQCRATVERYSDQDIGLADASNVVLAERHGTLSLFTLDRRHFSVVRTRRGPFRIVP